MPHHRTKLGDPSKAEPNGIYEDEATGSLYVFKNVAGHTTKAEIADQ